MWSRYAVVAALAAIGCDDHLYGVAVEEVEETPTYACDWEGVELFLQDHCNACHTRNDEGEVGAGGIALVEQLTEEATLDSPPPDALVIPGDPAASPLWQSVSGLGPALLMPYGRTEPLSEHQIQHISCWILDGAPL